MRQVQTTSLNLSSHQGAHLDHIDFSPVQQEAHLDHIDFSPVQQEAHLGRMDLPPKVQLQLQTTNFSYPSLIREI